MSENMMGHRVWLPTPSGDVREFVVASVETNGQRGIWSFTLTEPRAFIAELDVTS